VMYKREELLRCESCGSVHFNEREDVLVCIYCNAALFIAKPDKCKKCPYPHYMEAPRRDIAGEYYTTVWLCRRCHDCENFYGLLRFYIRHLAYIELADNCVRCAMLRGPGQYESMWDYCNYEYKR